MKPPECYDRTKDPGGKLAKYLESCGWELVTGRFDLETSRWHWVEPNLWEKERSRLLVDNIGVFLYRLKNKVWVRTHGLSHNLIIGAEIVFMDGSTLNLLTGEWNELD